MDGVVEAALVVVDLMALSARTAPKSRGLDALVIRSVPGDDLPVLAREMRRLGEATGQAFFVRDSGNVERSLGCLLVGSLVDSVLGLDCGGCGYRTCGEMLDAQRKFESQKTLFSGPNCVLRMADLGIALGSAARTAGLHNLDNRIMYSAGTAALSLGWLQGCKVAYGIPVSASGKSIFFDRSA